MRLRFRRIIIVLVLVCALVAVLHSRQAAPTDDEHLVNVVLSLHNEQDLNPQVVLTSDQFISKCCPTALKYDAVVAILKLRGFTILNDSVPNRLYVTVSGSTSQLKSLFTNPIAVDAAINGNASVKLQVTKDLADQDVSGVAGLSPVKYRPHLLKFNKLSWHGVKVTPNAPSGYSPVDLAKAYDYPNYANHRKYSGAGRTIAIATSGDFAESDISQFWKAFRVPRAGTITRVPIDGDGTSDGNIVGETELDVEYTTSEAPGANLMVYEAIAPETVPFDDMYNQIAIDNKADVVSISWGAPEADFNDSEMSLNREIFEEMAAQGQAVFVASGDSGAFDNQNSFTPAIDSPSDFAGVTAVGGTVIKIGKDGARQSESAWTFAGGGVSARIKRPDYQNSLPDSVCDHKYRNTADISANADNSDSPMPYYMNGEWGLAGGTSFAAPTNAGLWAVLDEAANRRIGSVNWLLYQIASDPDSYAASFYDVTTGDNSAGGPSGWPAGPGYDHPTGLGVIKGQALLDLILKQPQSKSVPVRKDLAALRQ